jgi:hypothetical protein
MFGFLNPRPHSETYRRVYARLCQHQHLHYGIGSLPFHSFEAVFLYQCAIDTGMIDFGKLPQKRCCKLMTSRSLMNESDAQVGQFCSSFGVLLASIKLEDDIRDSGSWGAWITRWLLRKRFEKANRYFLHLDPRFRKNVHQLIEDHHRLEQSSRTLSLDEYVEPTSQSFGYVFGTMSRIPGLESHRQTLIDLGRKIGSAIIRFDCAVDWVRDRSRGEFNPLRDTRSVEESWLLSIIDLEEATRIAKQSFGKECHSAQTLDRVRRRILDRHPLEQRTLSCSIHRSIRSHIQARFSQAIRKFRSIFLPVLSTKEGEEPSQEGSVPIEGKTPGRPLPPDLQRLLDEKKREEEENQKKQKKTKANSCGDCCFCGYGGDCGCAEAGCAEAGCCCCECGAGICG